MSKECKTTSSERFQLLAQQDEKVFHLDDLARLWKIHTPNTLHVTLYRYISKGLLFRIYRGFYSVLPVHKVDPHVLGVKAMHQYAYISTESVLVDNGILQQSYPTITIISAESRKFKIGEMEYQSRKLKDRSLYNPIGITDTGGYRKANVERAISDLLYFNRKVHFDNTNTIKWNLVKKIQKELEYPATEERY